MHEFNAFTDPNSFSYININTNSHSNTNGDSNTDIYSDTYSNCDIDPNSYTNTGYGLSTLTDNRPYQGSQHTIQFHGVSKRH